MLLHTPILSFPHIGLVPTGSIFFCQTWIHIGLFGFRFVCKVIKIQQLSGILDIWYKTTPWWLWRALRRFIFYLVWYKLHVLVVVQSEETTSSTFRYKWNAYFSMEYLTKLDSCLKLKSLFSTLWLYLICGLLSQVKELNI